MKKRIFRSLIICTTVILVFLTLIQFSSAYAQAAEGGVRIFQLDTSTFPRISFFMEASDPAGRPMDNLDASSIQILEDNTTPQKITRLEEVQPGIQMIVAYNLGPALSNSSTSGGTRFQAANEAIAAWVEGLPTNSLDDFSLATNTGLQVIREDNPQEFADSLRTYQPDLGNNQPNLTSLLQSLDLATDPNPNPLMKRVILYLTPQLNVTNVSAISGLIERAVQQNVIIHVWLVGPATVESTNPTVVDPLKEIASSTGGQFFLYSGEGALPNPEDYLHSLRTLYKVEYLSALNQSGSHRVSAILDYRGEELLSEPVSFSLDIRVPNIIAINPFFSIERVWQPHPQELNKYVLTPDQASISYIVEFPDGMTREIVSARLLENGEVVYETNTAPFTQFVWLLTKFEESQAVELMLEVEDSLGLVGRSIPINVQVTVKEKPLTFWQSLLQLQLSTERWIILGSVLFTGIVLVLAVILAGRRRNFWREQSAARERRTDPLTQPVPVRQEISRLGSGGSSAYPRNTGQEVSAWLVPLNDHFEALRAKAIPLTRAELIIGKDSRQSELVIPSPAMSDVHARLTRDQKGDFWLADNNSVAGTWVNYAPLSTQGCRLRHGDLVHFAKNVYRFELTNPTPDREPQLIPYNDDI